MSIKTPVRVEDALERWHNTDGFSCSFPEECVDPLHALASAYVQVREAFASGKVERLLRELALCDGVILSVLHQELRKLLGVTS